MTGGHGGFTGGGDPVCQLDRVCAECGAFREDLTAPLCARCGTPFSGEYAAAGDGPRERSPGGRAPGGHPGAGPDPESAAPPRPPED